MRINSVCVLGWTIFHQLLLVRAQTAPDNPIQIQTPTPPDNPIRIQTPTPPDNPIRIQTPTPPDNPISLPEILLQTKTHCINLWSIDPNRYSDMINPEAQPFSLCPGKEVPIVHLTDGKTKKIWLTFGFPRPTATNALSAYAAPTWQASFALPHGPGTIEVDENYCLNIVVGGGAKQQCLQRSCLNRKPSDGEPVRELNPYNLWNYYNDQIPDTRATCPGNDGASIPGNTGQIVGFNSGDEYVEPTIQAVSISTESEGEGVVSNNDIVGAAGSVPSVTDRPVPVDSLGFNSIPGSALPHAFNNNNNNNRAPMAAIPGDPYSDSNNSPINSWGETVMDWNKKNKRAAKLARRKFLRGLHGSE